MQSTHLMRKVGLALIISISASLQYSASAQENQWRKIAVDSVVTLEFPGVPARNWLKGQWVYELQKGNTVYMAMIKKDAYRVSPTASQLKDYYKGIIQGIMQGAGGGRVLAQTKFSIAEFEGIEVSFAPLKQLNFPIAQFVRVISIRGTDYCQVFLSADELSVNLENSRRRFFSSLQYASFDKETNAADDKTFLSTNNAGGSINNFIFYGLLGIALFLVALWFNKPKQIQ